MNFLNFPNTAAEPGASEKLRGRLGKLLGALGPVLSPLGRLSGSLEALLEPPGVLLGTSWAILRHSGGLSGASWAPFGPSWAVLEATQNKIKRKSILEPQTRAQKDQTPQSFGRHFGTPNRPKSEPKRVNI